MPKKKKLILSVISIVVLLFVILIYSNNTFHSVTTNPTVNKSKPIDVDNIVENPEKYTSVINVKGKVKELSDKKNFFSLGCEDDEDASIPVSYKGELPKSGSNVVLTGKIKKDADGKFFFDAKEIKYK